MAQIRYLIGPPGTGKTTTIARQVADACARYGRDHVSVCSLTKAAAREAGGRLSLPVGQVGTLHSFAYHALGGGITIAEKHTKTWNDAYPRWPMQVSKAEASDSPEERNPRDLLGEELLNTLSYYRARCLPLAQGDPMVREFGAAWTDWKKQTDCLDFTDLLEHALHDTVMAPHAPDALWVDEAQDLSLLEVRLLTHWERHLQELTIVGDPSQNLYSWRGSDADVVFPANTPSSDVRVLSQSYRLPTSVHARALEWLRQHRPYRDFAYAPRDARGMVAQSGATISQADVLAYDLELLLDEHASVMLQASCGYMLKPLLAALRKEGIPFHNPWRLKNNAWNPLTAGRMPERLMALLRRHLDGIWVPADVRLFGDVLKAEGIFKHGQKKNLALDDIPAWDTERWCRSLFTEEAMSVLWDADERPLVAWWEDHLTAAAAEQAAYPLELYRRRGQEAMTETPRLIVGTIHSLKGSEAECVVLAPDISKAMDDEWMFGDGGRNAIVRQFYVGLTRAKERLMVLTPSGRRQAWC